MVNVLGHTHTHKETDCITQTLHGLFCTSSTWPKSLQTKTRILGRGNTTFPLLFGCNTDLIRQCWLTSDEQQSQHCAPRHPSGSISDGNEDKVLTLYSACWFTDGGSGVVFHAHKDFFSRRTGTAELRTDFSNHHYNFALLAGLLGTVMLSVESH